MRLPKPNIENHAPVDFKKVNTTALARIHDVLAAFLPGGRVEAGEYSACNPMRDDRKRGSFKINLKSAAWADFAASDARGGDLSSLISYLHGVDQLEGARRLAAFLGLNGQESIQPSRPAKVVALPVKDAAAGEIVQPVPPDAPPMPSRHPVHGAHVAEWFYRDADGNVLFAIRRFEPVGERKQILPLSLWREPSGEMCWRWKGSPAPRPLYNSDKLATGPSAPVVSVEGEKCVDAAARVFPKSVCITSCGGSNAASKTDWSALAGRRVLVWPDNDDPGAKYAAEVAEILAGLGCDVSLIDAEALASLAPDGSKREPVAGWDSHDAVSEWTDLAKLRAAAVGLAKPFTPAVKPSFVSWGAFSMDQNGLSIAVKRGRGDNAEEVEEWVSSAFEILGATRDPSGRDWGKWLRWRDGDGREHVRHVSEAALQGDPAALAASLAGEGLRVSRTQQKALATYVSGVSTKGRVTLVPRTGWHSIGAHDVFVLPGETIGPSGSETIILDGAAHGPYEANGSLADWQAGVGSLVADHVLGVLVVSAALAGPLLHLSGQEGGGLNIYGPSSKGKTTFLQAAASVWGRGGSPGYIRGWRATANALEGAAASATDTCLILDELGLVEAREAAAAFYSLSNGSGKARASRDGSLREPKSWRVLSISSGEVPVETKLAEDKGRRARAGQMVRLLDVPCDRQKGFGAFDDAGPDGDASKLSKAIKLAAQSSFGVVGPEFIRRIIAERLDGEQVRAMVADFVAAEVPTGADGQIIRAAERLGLIAMAGELATALGVTPWRAGAAREAAAWALARWIEGRGGAEPAEVRQAVEAVRLAVEQFGESRFEPLDGGGDGWKPMGSRLGWRTGDGTDRQWLIPSEIWKTEVCAGIDPKFAARVLGERGFLEKAGDGWQPVRRIGGRAMRVFVVNSGVFDGGEHGA